MKELPARKPERTALGVGLTLAEGSSKLFGRSVFKNFVLDSVMIPALVVTSAEFGLGSVVLLLVAYRLQLLRLIRPRRPRPERLRFTLGTLTAIVVCGGCNVWGRGMITLAITSRGTPLATINAITFAVSTVLYSAEVWRARQRLAAVLVPLLIILGLAISIQAWHTTVSPWGVIWSIGSASSGIVYMVASRKYIERGGADSDQFQALSTAMGVVGLVLWAVLAGENPSAGWSWGIVVALACTALGTVVIPRYLHTKARQVLSDGFYTVLWSVIPLLGLLIDLIMEHRIPTVWQTSGMFLIGMVAAGVAWIRQPPEWKAVQRSRLRRVAKRPFGRRSTFG